MHTPSRCLSGSQGKLHNPHLSSRRTRVPEAAHLAAWLFVAGATGRCFCAAIRINPSPSHCFWHSHLVAEEPHSPLESDPETEDRAGGLVKMNPPAGKPGTSVSAPFGHGQLSCQQLAPMQHSWPRSILPRIGHEHMFGKGSACHYLLRQSLPNKSYRIARTVSSGSFPKASLLKSNPRLPSSTSLCFHQQTPEEFPVKGCP